MTPSTISDDSGPQIGGSFNKPRSLAAPSNSASASSATLKPILDSGLQCVCILDAKAFLAQRPSVMTAWFVRRNNISGHQKPCHGQESCRARHTEAARGFSGKLTHRN